MKRTVVIYALLMAISVGVYKYLEVQYFSKSISREITISLIAALFCGAGIWMGLKFRKPAAGKLELSVNEDKSRELGVSKRELEILELVAEGYSNKEISEKLFISIHTVKSHSSKLYSKLNAKRRTEAVLNAKKLGLLDYQILE